MLPIGTYVYGIQRDVEEKGYRTSYSAQKVFYIPKNNIFVDGVVRREIVELIFSYASNSNKHYFDEINKCECILLLFCPIYQKTNALLFTFKVEIALCLALCLALCFLMRNDCNSARKYIHSLFMLY